MAVEEDGVVCVVGGLKLHPIKVVVDGIARFLEWMMMIPQLVLIKGRVGYIES